MSIELRLVRGNGQRLVARRPSNEKCENVPVQSIDLLHLLAGGAAGCARETRSRRHPSHSGIRREIAGTGFPPAMQVMMVLLRLSSFTAGFARRLAQVRPFPNALFASVSLSTAPGSVWATSPATSSIPVVGQE